MGGTMRLGADPIKLHDGTRAREIYGEAVIYERHRHRYEVNNLLRRRLEAAGLVVLGHLARRAPRRGDRAAADHPFFVASQYHPEFKSRPERPAPLFREFVARRARRGRERGAARGDAASAAATRQSARTSRPREARHATAERARLERARSPTLCRIESPSGRERACADRVAAELRGIGLEVVEDDAAGPRPASDCGNLLARLPGRGEAPRTVLLCAHLDTVPLAGADRAGASSTAAGRTPTTAILGADNKAAVAVMLELARRLRSQGAPVGIELLFTVARGERAARAPRPSTPRRLRTRLRLRLRPRDADRRGRRRLADLLPHRGRLPRRRRARRHPARGRAAARSLAAARAVAAMRARAHRRRDDRERRRDPRRRSAARTSCPTAAASRPRPARSTTRARRERGRRDGRRASTTAPTPGVRRRRDRRAAVRGLPPPAVDARRSSRREAALRACGYEPRRIATGGGVGRERARGQRLPVRQPRQRHRAQPRARRARQRRRARGDARRGLALARRRRRDRQLARAEAAPRRRSSRPSPPAGARASASSVDVDGRAPRPRSADVGLRGRARRPGDEVVVNVEARDLGLGSGGFDVVHVNLTRGLGGARARAGAHVMKLNYTSLQHAVLPVEGDGARRCRSARPVAVLRRCTASSRRSRGRSAPAAPGRARSGYVQTAGGALPGGAVGTVARPARARAARRPPDRGPGVRRRGRGDQHGRGDPPRPARPRLGRGRRAARARGSSGSASALGHGGMVGARLRARRAGAGLPDARSWRGCPAADPRERHRGLSHHTTTVLELLLGRAVAPSARCPTSARTLAPCRSATARVERGAADLDGYARERRCRRAPMGRHAGAGPGASSPRRSPPASALAGHDRGVSGSGFELVGGETVWRGPDRLGARRALPPRRRRGGRRARSCAHPGAVAIVAHDDEQPVARAPAARGGRRARPARDPGRQARRSRRGAARDGAARARRGDRQDGASTGSDLTDLRRAPASPTSASASASRPACATPTASTRPRRTSASRSSPGRSRASTS